jgi:MFS family permease
MKILPTPKNRSVSPLILFSIIIFMISLHDGIISYVTPLLINNTYNSTVIVGGILSISSFFGIFFNFFVARFFPKKGYKFFTSWMIFFALLMPLILLKIPETLVPLVLAMIVWSIYYEFRNYSKFDFVKTFLPSNKNAEAWSVMTVFQSTAYLFGPILALFLMERGLKSALIGSLAIVILAFLCYRIYSQIFGKKQLKNSDREVRSLLKEFRVINIITRKIWPLVLFSFSITLLDVSFWTSGVLYSEKLRLQNELGGLLLPFYGMPTIIVGIIAPKIYATLGKKRTSFAAGLAAGLGLIILGLVNNVFLILGTVFLTAFFSNIAFILISATYEDYITRLDGEGNNLVSVNEVAQNLAYAVGPIVLGIASRNGNFGKSFIFTGIILISVSLLAIFVVPRKIRMPHKEIARETL